MHKLAVTSDGSIGGRGGGPMGPGKLFFWLKFVRSKGLKYFAFAAIKGQTPRGSIFRTRKGHLN